MTTDVHKIKVCTVLSGRARPRPFTDSPMRRHTSSVSIREPSAHSCEPGALSTERQGAAKRFRDTSPRQAKGAVRSLHIAAPRSSRKIRVVVSQATPIACQLLDQALRRSRFCFDVVGSAVNAEKLIQAVAHLRPEIVLVSAAMEDGPLAGFQALREIHAHFPDTQPVLLVESSDPEKVVNAFRAGAKGVFGASGSIKSLCKCLYSVHRGQIWATSRELQYLLEALSRVAPLRMGRQGSAAPLTHREKQVANLVAEGFTNAEISKELKLSAHTVKNYLFRMFEKLEVSSRVELALYAARLASESDTIFPDSPSLLRDTGG